MEKLRKEQIAQRVARGKELLSHYLGSAEGLEAAVIDVIADICHYARQELIRPENTLKLGYGHYLSESNKDAPFDVNLTATQVSYAAITNAGIQHVESVDVTTRYFVDYDPSRVSQQDAVDAVEEHVSSTVITEPYFIPVESDTTVKVLGVEVDVKPTPFPS